VRIDHADPDWPMGARPDMRRTQVPIGPVLVFAASDFPFAFSVFGGDTTSALAAGCPVVVTLGAGQFRTTASEVVARLAEHAGRVLWNRWPTGVTVSDAQHHGGPYPATTAPLTTSVGTAAAARFLRPVAFQNVPEAVLPAELRDDATGPRRVDGSVRA
jgi:NADP-dependent aldehyde dehydrogenase